MSLLGQINEPGIIANLLRWSQDRPSVRAVLLTSTRANPQAPVDAFSDYDVILAVTDIRPYFADRAWLEDFGRVLVLYRDPIKPIFDCEKFAYITQYEDGLKIDFTLWPVELVRRVAAEPELPNYLDVGYQILLDKDGLTEELRPPTHRAFIPKPPTAAEFQTLVEEFFHEATYVAKHLRRGDLLPAKYNLDQAMKQDNLRRMLEWRAEIDHDWSVKTGAYGKGLRKLLPPEILTKLEGTYVGAGPEENWEALFRTIGLFRRVATEVAGHLGLAYPLDLDRRVVEYLQKAKSDGGALGG